MVHETDRLILLYSGERVMRLQLEANAIRATHEAKLNELRHAAAEQTKARARIAETYSLGQQDTINGDTGEITRAPAPAPEPPAIPAE